MTCAQAQISLSLYLYGELDFAQEEELEEHLKGCAFCQHALAREKIWHTALNAERTDVPLELLAGCRESLKSAISSSRPERKRGPVPWLSWTERFGFSLTRWSAGLALASFLVFVGFTSARWIDRHGVPGGFQAGGTTSMGLLNPSTARVRDIQPGADDRVRIVFDQVREREITGRPDEDMVRQLLLAATKDPADPGIRVDSVEMLKNQSGIEVRDALLYSAQHDSNAAVRLKALEGLRRFIDDPVTRAGLKFVLEHDDNPGVRSEAINILAPASEMFQFNGQLASTLQDVMRAQQDDDYVRARCLQVLQEMQVSQDVY
jgi:hypothetical protein